MIAVDVSCIWIGELEMGSLSSGISVFVGDMLNAFEAAGKADQFVLLAEPQQAPYIKKMFPAYRCIALPVWNWIYRAAEKLVSMASGGKRNGRGVIKKIQRRNVCLAKKLVCRFERNVELAWLPFAVPELVTKLPVPIVGTIHDLAFFYRNKARAEIADKIGNQFAHLHAVTISEFVKAEVDRWIGKYKLDTRVIPNAVTIDASRQESVDGLEPFHFILDINAYAKHKNPITLLDAFEKIADQTDQHLVFCGYNLGFLEEVEAEREKSPYKDRIHILVSIPTAQRNWLLTHCTMLVTPSLSEGFGRTPIEAALCRRPVLSTRCTSLYDVTMGLVHYVDDPEDTDEFAAKMLEIIVNPDSPEKLEGIAQRFSEEYSHARCAREYMDYFRWVIQKEDGKKG